jgi:transcriptional regulator with XRE-family HTH domain
MPKQPLVNNDEVTLSIGEVARSVDVSPGMLRRWEQEDLIRPARTSGGQRVFRQSDVKRVRRVVKLWRDGLNTVAIARELGPIKTDDEPPPAAVHPGPRVRMLRTQRGLTLQELAAEADVSVSFLSALERGRTGVSMERLFRIAEALGTTLPALGSDSISTTSPLVRPHERDSFVSPDGGHLLESLITTPGGLEVSLSTIYPGSGSDDSYRHSGQEFIYVLSGRLDFWLDGERFALSPGCALHFQSSREHHWTNPGRQPTRVIWVNAPTDQGIRARPSAHQ